MKKIAIICPYFGVFPSNIELTLNSMQYNNWIDWYILTDNREYDGLYDNVYCIPFTFKQMQDLVKKEIGTQLLFPYKICDYKPTFGWLFKEYLKEYDFWGYCDLDAIYGDLRIAFTDEILTHYDKVFDQGHLSIYRNTDNINKAFMGNQKIYIDYKRILNSIAIEVFDETYSQEHKGINGILELMGYSIYTNRSMYADLNRIRKNFYPICLPKAHYYYLEYNHGKLFVRRTDNNTYSYEVVYAHYQKKKNLPVLCKNRISYYSVPRGFIDKTSLTCECFYEKFDYQLILLINIVIKRKFLKIKEKLKQILV